MEQSKVIRHPDKDELIKMLLNGDSVKQIEAWLKKKYPRSKRHHISYMTLQKFRAEQLNIKGDLLEDIKTKKRSDELISTNTETRLAVSNSSEYQKKVEEIVSNEMDVARKLLEMEKLISARMEFYYNAVANGGSIKHDRVFLEYLNTMRSVMQDWKKYIEGFADVPLATLDTQLLAANISQAIARTQSNMAVEDIKPISNENSNSAKDNSDTKNKTIRPNVLINSKKSNNSKPTQSATNMGMNSTKPTNMGMNSTKPTNMGMNSPKPTMNMKMNSTKPTMNMKMNSTKPTMNMSMNSTKPTMKTMNTNMSMNSTKPTMKTMNTNMSMNSTKPTTMGMNSISNNKNKSSFKNTESFINKTKYNEDSEDETNGEYEDENEDQDLNTREDYEDYEDLDVDESNEEYEEGFKGSKYIEHKFFKKILLALLITFMGYILILSSINNLIPISTYTPHLKQFKHLIYGFVFFLITYLCLEVF